MIKKMILLFCINLGIIPICFCQKENAAVRNLLNNIRDVYDTLNNFSVDVRYTSKIEEATAGDGVQTMEGHYTLQGNFARYTLGQVECIQNDSFFVGVYNNDRLMVVSKPQSNANTRFFPMQGAVDSLLKIPADKYDVTIMEDVSGKTGKIRFLAKEPSEKVTLFELEYYNSSRLLKSVQYQFKDYVPAPANDTTGVGYILKHKSLLMEFYNLSFEKSPESAFNHRQYFSFEGTEIKAADKFYGFKTYYTTAPVGNVVKKSGRP